MRYNFISRTEYQVFPLELPPVSRKEREQAVLNRLRGQYPFKLDDKFIVVHPNGRRGAYLGMVFDDSLRSDPLNLSTLAAAKICRKDKKNCVIAWENWIEYLTLENGQILSSLVTAREYVLSRQLAERAAEWFNTAEDLPAEAEEKKPVVEVFCSANEYPAETFYDNGNFILKYTTLEKALSSLSISAWACYPGRLAQVKKRRLLFVIAACIALIFSALSVRNWYAQRETDLAARRETERHIALEKAEQKTREERLAALKAAWEEQFAGHHIGVYRTIETIASCLSPATCLSSALFKENGNFRLDGTAVNATAVLNDLQAHPEVHDADIGTIVWDAGTQRFTINGTVKWRLLLPDSTLSTFEKIVWYENKLADPVPDRDMPETAASAAEKIRELMERHRLHITRFRYLDVHAGFGWTIECSLSGTGVQIVQALKEADTAKADSPLQVTALETRSQKNLIDAIITFFVHGPGKRSFQGNYEEHPSPAKIALLYGLPFMRSPPQVQAQPAAKAKPAEIPQPATTIKRSLEYVGFVKAVNGNQYIYVKDVKSGELYRLTEGQESYSYRINTAGIITASLDDASKQMEVRRNDGF